jgi:DNA-directed RNA polymerase specialized sigma24 family protein
LSARLAVSRRTARTDPARERVTYEAAAEVLGVPVGIVRPRLSRGRDTLRRLMGISEEAKIATG